MKKSFLRTGFVLLLSVSCLHGLWSQQSAGASVTETMRNSEPLSTEQTPENFNNDMTQQSPNSEESQQLLINPNNPWDDLRSWINEGMKGLDESAESLTILESQLAALRAENSEQESLLTQSQELLTNLKSSLTEAQNNVDIAVDRMQDAEDYALWIDAQNIQLKQDVERLKKSAPVGFVIGGMGFGVGVPLAVEGIRSDNKTMMWSGVGTAVGTGLIWAAGHYLFEWW